LGTDNNKNRIEGPLSYLKQINKLFGKKFEIPEINEKLQIMNTLKNESGKNLIKLLL